MDLNSVLPSLSGNPLKALPFVFAGGVLTSLTPCIYPMIPITAAIVGGTSVAEGSSKPPRWRPVVLPHLRAVMALVYSAGLCGDDGTLFGSVVPIRALRHGDLLCWRRCRRAAGARRVNFERAHGRDSGRCRARLPRGRCRFRGAPCSAPVMAAVLTWVVDQVGRSELHLFVFRSGCTLLVVVGRRQARSAAHRDVDGVVNDLRLVMVGVAEYYP